MGCLYGLCVPTYVIYSLLYRSNHLCYYFVLITLVYFGLIGDWVSVGWGHFLVFAYDSLVKCGLCIPVVFLVLLYTYTFYLMIL